MAGTQQSLRVAGMPDSGFPSEIDAGIKVRYVAPLVSNMSERSTDLLKYLGGLERFVYTNAKIEWLDDDPWNRRLALGANPLTSNTDTVLDVAAGTAHRYPVGTILYNVTQNEYVRVTGHTESAQGQNDQLQVVRGYAGSTAAASWAQTDEVFVVGNSFSEDMTWVYRPTPTLSTSYNYSQVFSAGVQVSFRRLETAFYGLRGSDLDYVAANTVAEQFVAIEMAALHGTRYAGADANNPPSFGGIKYFLGSSIGEAYDSNLNGAVLTRKDIEDALQDRYYNVGGDKMAKTLIVSAWAKRKIDSFFAAAERLGPGTTDAGVVVDRLNTSFGPVDILLHTALSKDEIIFLNREQHLIGHHGRQGRPQLRQLPPLVSGPRVQQVFYADLSMINAGPRAEGRIYGFSQTA